MSRIYFVVNSDLEMSAGKIAAQVGHGMQYVMEYYLTHVESQHDIKDYKASGSAKIILKAPESKIIMLYEKYRHISFLVTDAGKTEIAPGSITVLAFLPMQVDEQLKELKRFKLF